MRGRVEGPAVAFAFAFRKPYPTTIWGAPHLDFEMWESTNPTQLAQSSTNSGAPSIRQPHRRMGGKARTPNHHRQFPPPPVKFTHDRNLPPARFGGAAFRGVACSGSGSIRQLGHNAGPRQRYGVPHSHAGHSRRPAGRGRLCCSPLHLSPSPVRTSQPATGPRAATFGCAAAAFLRYISSSHSTSHLISVLAR